MWWSLAIFFAVCTLPSVFGGGLNCQSCTESPLQSPEKCNMSNTEEYCGSNDKCIALTAELMNGTLVGIRGCFPDSAGQCTNISACNQRNESLPDGVYFERCVAECCTQPRCNKGLFPMLPELPSPSSVRVMVSSSIAGSAKTTQASTTQAPKDPTAAGIKMKAFLHLPIFLLIIIKIMS
ncbi:uncharacterized protein LOC144652952 [Oculina patagonica]